MKLYNANANIPCDILHFCDGDTVVIRAHCPCCGLSRQISVRLKGIESHEPRGTTKVAARAVADKWTKSHSGKKAELVPTQTGSDKYGRVVGAIFCEGKSLADSLVQAGDAWPYHYKSNRSPSNESNLR